MSFPPGTEMFQFPGFASDPYVFRAGSPCGGVSPFGHPRINDRSHLPAAYRSVPRPSSPLGAKASTERPSHTHHPPPPARRTKPPQGSPPRTPRPPRVQPDDGATPRHSTPDGKSARQALNSPIPIHLSNNTETPPGPALSCRRPCEWGFPEPRSNGSRRRTPSPWRRSDSNRRPPACKAGALPLSYAPSREPFNGLAPDQLITGPEPCPEGHVWAREDLNLRPHAYQACALTN